MAAFATWRVIPLFSLLGQRVDFSLLQEHYFHYPEHYYSSYQKLSPTQELNSFIFLSNYVLPPPPPHCSLNYINSLWNIGKSKKKSTKVMIFLKLPVFYHSKISSDIVRLHVSSPPVLYCIYAHTLTNRYKTGRHKIRIVMITLFYNLQFFFTEH